MAESNPTPDQPIRRVSIFRRIRPVWYIVGGTLLLLALIVTLVYIVSLGRKPTPTVDYLAMLNAPALAVPEEDAAWPIYRELAIKYDVLNLKPLPGWGPKRNPSYNKSPATQPAGSTTTLSLDEIWGTVPLHTSVPFLDSVGPITRDDPRWPQAMAEALKYADLYEGLRQAGRKKGSGALVSDRYDPANGYKLIAHHRDGVDPLWHNSISHSANPLWRFRRIYIDMLTVDFQIALHQGDIPRAIANLQAQQDLARHLMEVPLFISRLMSYGIRTEMMGNMATLLAEQGQDLTPDQYQSLEKMLDPVWNQTALLAAERLMHQDSMQRIYDRQGVITYTGIQSLGDKNYVYYVIKDLLHERYISQAPLTVQMPWLQIKTGSAQEQLTEYDRLVKESMRISTLPLDQQESEYARLTRDRLFQWGKYWPLAVTLISSLNSSHYVFSISELMQGDAMRVAIALEQHRKRTGQYPASLTDLIPHELPEIPEDRTTGKGDRLLYKRVDGNPIIYSRGHDGIDNALQPALRPGSQDKGDWQLYPPKLD